MNTNDSASVRRLTVICAACLLGGGLAAHEEGAPFSGAIIDPPILHHAHTENEQRLNFFALRGVPDENGVKHFGYETELELAFATKNYRYGFELFVPVLNLAAPDGRRRVTGLGDMEIRPVKLALVMIPDFIVSTASGFSVPTGRETAGLGGGNAAFTQYLFMDKAVGNWAVGVNLGLGTAISGPKEASFEYGVGLAYSFIRGTKLGEIAPERPNQKWVIAPSLEIVGQRALRGERRGLDEMSIVPGLTLWHVQSGWQFRVGVQLPLTREREADAAVLFQVGNHLNWRRLLGLGEAPRQP